MRKKKIANNIFNFFEVFLIYINFFCVFIFCSMKCLNFNIVMNTSFQRNYMEKSY